MKIELTDNDNAYVGKVFEYAIRHTERRAKADAVYVEINAQMVALAAKWPEMDADDIDTFDMMFAAKACNCSVEDERRLYDLYGKIVDDQIEAAA